MDRLVQIVGGYSDRDKIIRLCQYLARFISGTGQTRWQKNLAAISSELSSCRTILRLFDDIPMLASTLNYGTGSKETNKWMRFLELLSNCTNQLYYPFEHIAWLADKHIIDRSSAKWWDACIAAWAVSLLTEILKAIVRLWLIKNTQRKLLRETELEAEHDRDSTEMSVTIRGQQKALKSQTFHQYLILLENIADIVNAINWLPAGFMWAQKLSPRFCGGMGTISSLIKLYRLHSVKSKQS